MTASLRALLEERVAADPDAVALVGSTGVGGTGVGGAEDVTWAQLQERAVRVAAALVRSGTGVQDRVLYVGKNDVRFFDVLFGCALAGAVPTPVNWRLAPGEATVIINDSEAATLLVDPEQAGLVEQVEPHLEHVRTLVSLGHHDRWQDWEQWAVPGEDPGVLPQPEHIALQLYTSGTTGRPKGAMFANGTNLRVLLDDISRAWGFTGSDVSLLCMPLFHMGGVAWALAGMARGARGVVVRDFEPRAVLDLVDREGVTAVFCVPAMLAGLTSAASGRPPVALRRLVYSGAPVSSTALAAAMAALRCDFVQIYGLTEATGAFAQLPPEDHDPDGPRAGLLRAAGRPYPWVDVRVVDPATRADRAVGEVGEVWTRSEQNLVGYWKLPEESARMLTPDGWLRTGDLGRVDDEGRIYLVDRAKDMIITGGENVYPAEVENVLAAHPAVAEVAVIGVPDARWGETVKAFVVATDGAAPDPADLLGFAREHLTHFKCPTSVEVVASLPRTATGKVVKGQLREPYWRGRERLIS